MLLLHEGPQLLLLGLLKWGEGVPAPRLLHNKLGTMPAMTHVVATAWIVTAVQPFYSLVALRARHALRSPKMCAFRKPLACRYTRVSQACSMHRSRQKEV